MKRGQTIAAEREYVESESERLQARKKLKRKHFVSVILALLLLVILALIAYTGAKDMAKEVIRPSNSNVNEYTVQAQVVDESGAEQISGRTMEYIGQVEQDFKELGYKLTKVTLPAGMSREIFVDVKGVPYYFKINVDRGAAVSVEDAVRMIKYLTEKGLEPVYVDVRVEGKAFYQ